MKLRPATVAALALLALLAWPDRARADLPTQSEMAAEMDSYFGGERTQGLVFAAVGVASLALGGIAIARGGRTLRAMSAPVIGIGLLQLAVGGTVFLRTDAQRQALHRQLGEDPAAYTLAELKRIEAVKRRFDLYRWVEIGLLFGGAGALAIGARRNNEILLGIGIGLAVQAGLTLALDAIAAERAVAYARTLAMFRLNASLLPVGPGGLIFSLAGRF